MTVSMREDCAAADEAGLNAAFIFTPNHDAISVGKNFDKTFASPLMFRA
jgi:hypothetical protein